MRDYKKLKVLSDYNGILDAPQWIHMPIPRMIKEEQMVLRVLVRAKYGEFKIPPFLQYLNPCISQLFDNESLNLGIPDSWCYVTVRHGKVTSKRDDEWHFDGPSFRTDVIPDRNYIWVSHTPTEYKMGSLVIPGDFDPMHHNLFNLAEHQLKDAPIHTISSGEWYLLSPFVFHRRPTITTGEVRTFIRISFTDIEIRDINNTPNPLIPTEFYGRDPVRTFRNNLVNYY